MSTILMFLKFVTYLRLLLRNYLHTMLNLCIQVGIICQEYVRIVTHNSNLCQTLIID